MSKQKLEQFAKDFEDLKTVKSHLQWDLHNTQIKIDSLLEELKEYRVKHGLALTDEQVEVVESFISERYREEETKDGGGE